MSSIAIPVKINEEMKPFTFSGPFYHTRPFDRDFGCVYILINSLNKIVDVGETGSINSRIINHERKLCWIQNGCSEESLYVYTNGNEQLRRSLEKLIRDQYGPVCGER